MSDDEVSVKLTAQPEEMKAGLADASNALREAVTAMKGGLHDLEGKAEETNELLHSILNGELFIIFKEVATEALEAVKGAFESTVARAEEFGLANAKFAAMMGTSEEQAAGLSAALTNVGSSTDAYESIALKLEKTLSSGHGVSKDLVEQFKDQNGELLKGAPLMDRLQEVTSKYEEGGARTAVTLELLGRQTKSYYDISRVTAESVEHNSKIYKEMGVNFDTLHESSVKLEEAEGDLRTAWKAETIVIGQELMPVAQAALTWLGGEGTALLKSIGTAVKVLMTTFDVLKSSVVTVVVGIVGALDGLWQSLKMGGAILYDIVHGDYDKIGADFSKGMAAIKATASTTAQTISHEWDDVAAHMEALWLKPAEAAARAKAPGLPAPDDDKKKKGKAGPDKPDKSEVEDISSDEKIALAKIAIGEDTDKHLAAMGRETQDTLLAQERDAEDQKFLVKSAALHAQMALKGQTKVQEEKLLDDILLLNVTHNGELIKLDQQAEVAKAALAKESLANSLHDDDERLKEGRAALEESVSMGQMSAVERDNAEMRLTQTVQQEELARLDANISTLTRGTKAYDDAIKQREGIEKRFTAEIHAENTRRTQDTINEVKRWTTPMTAGFSTAMNDMILHGKSFGDSMRAMGDQMLAGFLNVIEQMAEQWLVKAITNEIVGTTTTGTMARSEIASEAAVAAAAAFASTAAIPGGLIAAPAAAGAAYAEVMAWQASVPAAAGGMLLDRDQLVYAHKDEQILPAHLSKGLQSIINNAGNTSASSNVTVHYAPNIKGEQANVGAWLRDNVGQVVSLIEQAQRDGRFRSGR